VSVAALNHAAPEPRLGFYGKLPARGDFLGRRLPRAFIDPWDGWLQEAIGTSREQLGDEWLPRYLEAPLWRFALGPGLCGEAAVTGVMMPSVDRVGRYFPLALAVPLAPGAALLAIAVEAGPWYERVEDLALSALEDELDFDAFDKALEEIAAPAAPAGSGWSAGQAHAVELADLGGLQAAAPELLDRALGDAAPRRSLWWTAGSEKVKPSLVAALGLPPAASFAALLDGSWERWGWNRP
jgi:type VI secretion system protein ImpM